MSIGLGRTSWPAIRIRLPRGQRRQRGPNLLEPPPVELGRDHCLLVRRGGDDDAPRLRAQRPPEAEPARPSLADLSGGRDVVLVLDRASPEQDLPVILAGVERA